MKKRDLNSVVILIGAALLASFSGLLSAQQAASAAATAAADTAATPAEVVEPSVAPVKPRPAEIMPLSPKNLLLDVVNTGQHLIAVGDRGSILVSNNGKDWAQVATPVRSPLTAVSFADEKIGWVVGHDAVILNTTDGGKTWLMQNFQPELEKAFLDVIALDANHVVALGAYGLLYKTADGGITWGAIDAPAIREGELHLNAIAKLNNGVLLAVGEQGTMGISADGGSAWKKLTAPYEGSFYGALPLGPKGAMVFGLRGNVFKTEDVNVGRWTQITTNTVASFFGGTNLPDGGVALVGLAGVILRLDATGTPTQLRVKIEAVDANGNNTLKEITGSFSAVVPFANGLLVVGEEGVQSLKLN